MNRRTALAAAAGIVLGLLYTLSPMAVWFAAGAAVTVRLAARDLSQDERRWVIAVLVIAIAARVLAIVALFVTTDHFRMPFGSFFGDEEYFIKRAWWLRNVALGIPIHRADLIYAFDEYSQTSYLYVLGLAQVLVGPSPYGAHLLGTWLYLGMCVVLFRVARGRFGRLPAHGGLLLLLFLPSLFAWSISALKEPLFFFLAAISVWIVDSAIRSRSWAARVAGVAALVVVGITLQGIREGGLAMLVVGIGGGAVLAALFVRPRVTATAVVLAPALVVALWVQPNVQIRLARTVEQAAALNWGHVNTPGYSYKLLDERLYEARAAIATMTLGEDLRFVSRALIAYVVRPLPWNIQSRTALFYLPEQVIWYAMIGIIPIGIVAGLRRDRLLACVLMMYATAAALMVALTGGNFGTLVRHRGLALPYLVWFVALGACSAIARLTTGPRLRTGEPLRALQEKANADVGSR